MKRSAKISKDSSLSWQRGLFAFLLVLAPAATGQQYTFSNYGLESGLANVNVTAFLEARSGVIWVGTQKGIFRANGAGFEQQDAFTDVGMEGVWAMRDDNEGRVWVADGSHVVYWENGRVHAVQGFSLHILNVSGVDLISVPGEHDAIYLLHDSVLQRIASTDHGKSWQASAAFDPVLVRQHPELNQLASVVASRGSKVWAGCGNAICAIDLAQGSVKKFGLREGVFADSWTNFLLTRSGEIWAQGGHSLERLRAGSDRFSTVSGLPKGRYLSASAPSLVEDPEGKVLINFVGCLIRTDGKKWQILDQKNGLPQDDVEKMIFDHTGTLWLALSGHGISRWLGYGKWEAFTKADGLSSNIILAIAQDQAGKKWVATEVGLDSMEPGTSRVTKLNQLSLHQLTAVVAHGGHVWTGDALGRVVDFDPATGHTRVVLEHLDTVYQILADKEDRIWICSPKGLDYFVPADHWSSPHHVDQSLLPNGNAYGISEGLAGVLWVMTEKGMYRLDGTGWTAIRLPVKAGPSYNLMAAAAADGTLWVQSRHPTKIVHLKVVDHTAFILSEFSDPTMQSENLGFMNLDRRGWLWIESDRGVHVFNGMQWVRCNSEDGLLSDNPDYPAFLADYDGSIWIGTSSGLSHMLQPEDVFSPAKPTVELADLQLGESRLQEGVLVEFDLRRPPLIVRLLGTNYSRASAIVYHYRLEGLESTWQETESSSLRFPALDPGRYTLRVTAFDRRLHETSEEHAVSFIILEPWWNRLWFRAIELLLAAAILLGLWRLSVRLLVMRQHELEAMIASRTSELERERAELLSARSTLIEMTRRDTLTGLLNRAAIFERMQALCEVSLATGSKLAIVMADIDHFKHINDEYGHVFGDLAIRECADRITRTIRPVDFVGRYGGEELLILMPGLDPASSIDRMEEIRMAIAGEPIRRGAVALQVTCSFGVAWMGDERCALELLVDMADEALYLAKKNGRNRVEFRPRELAGLNQAW